MPRLTDRSVRLVSSSWFQGAETIGHPQRLEQRIAEVKDAIAGLEAEFAREPAALSRDAGGE